MVVVETLNPAKVDNKTYEQLHAIGLAACAESFKPGYDPSQYIGNLFDFIKSHLDPMLDVENPEGRRYNNQEYHHPLLFIAWQGDRIVGWATTDHNVSGGGRPDEPHNTSVKARVSRGIRRLPPFTHNYLHIPEIYVDPQYQGRGIGTKTLFEATRLIHLAFPTMPPVAYTYTGVESGIYKEGKLDPKSWFSKYGFKQTNHRLEDQERDVPGLGEVLMIRLQHPSTMRFHQQLAQHRR
ncbi:MAG: GNAT family N-acetyltransferase [Candidatus Saccharimonadales bacterium]